MPRCAESATTALYLAEGPLAAVGPLVTSSPSNTATSPWTVSWVHLTQTEDCRTANQTTSSTLAATISNNEIIQIIQTTRRADGFMGCQTRRMYQRQGAKRCQRAHRFK